MRARIAGFTFIELMVVMAIAGLLLVVSVPNFTKLLETQAYRGAVRDVVSAARAAKTRAIRTNRPVDLAIDTQSRTLFISPAGDVELREPLITLPDFVAISVTSAAGLGPANGRSIIRFYPAGGSTGGDIELLRPSGVGHLIQVGWLLGSVNHEPI